MFVCCNFYNYVANNKGGNFMSIAYQYQILKSYQTHMPACHVVTDHHKYKFKWFNIILMYKYNLITRIFVVTAKVLL